MRAAVVILTGGAMLLASCGGGDGGGLSDALTNGQDEPSGAVDTAVDGGVGANSDDAAVAPEPVGPADMNTIRVGSQVWERTLPMTTGQCYVFEDDGTLPSSGNAWGTLDGDDGLRFSAKQNQDGAFGAEVESEDEFWWVAGDRSQGPDDLQVELDFEALTITGQGTFTDYYTGESAAGSFAFQCEDDGTGTG